MLTPDRDLELEGVHDHLSRLRQQDGNSARRVEVREVWVLRAGVSGTKG